MTNEQIANIQQEITKIDGNSGYTSTVWAKGGRVRIYVTTSLGSQLKGYIDATAKSVALACDTFGRSHYQEIKGIVKSVLAK